MIRYAPPVQHEDALSSENHAEPPLPIEVEEIEDSLDPLPDIEIQRRTQKRVKRLKADGWDHKVIIKIPDQMPQDLMRFFGKAFERITHDVLDNIPDHDAVGLTFSWTNLEYIAYYPLGLKKDFSVERFLTKLDGILQSNANLSLTDPITVAVTHVEMPQGGAQGKREGISV